MAADLAIVEALERALSVDPGAESVRLHLAHVLADGGEPERALPHCEELLRANPDDVTVLRFAAEVATATGDDRRAVSFLRLVDLLDPPTRLTVPAEAQPADPFGDEVDQFVRNVLRQDAERNVTLEDVGGLEKVKQRLRMSFLEPLRNPELRRAYGKSLRGGLLLWGPPGCGKTFLARAVAGELGAAFISVGIHETLDMYIGNSERNLHSFFELARRSQPSVLFFDEVDALGHSRSRAGAGALRGVVAQLLAEMDGLGSDNEGVFTLAATNQPWDVDPALRRPGRFDRTLLVLPPDDDARRRILELQLAGRPISNLDLTRIASATDGYSGADLRLVCESALETAFGEAAARGVLRPITQEHLEAAVKATKPSVGPWLENARNYAKYANDEGDYDELEAYLRRRPRRHG